MNNLKLENPLIIGSPSVMGLSWVMAAQKTYWEGYMKKYFPIQYQMMKAIEKLTSK